MGAASLVVAGLTLGTVGRSPRIAVDRAEAAAIARRALQERGVQLDSRWRVLPTPDDGSGGAHEFVGRTAGNDRRTALAGTYLPRPRWVVRVVSFEGDVADRAEEWRVAISGTGEVRSIQHTLPQERPGASLDEEQARRLAREALRRRTDLDAASGQAREVSARAARLPARVDWTFTFADTTLDPPLPQGEPRITVVLAGDEVVQVGRYVHVPEDWERRERAARTVRLVLQIVTGVTFGGLLVSAAVTAVIAWSRRRYAPMLFVAAAGLMFVVSCANAANAWPSVLAELQTAQPFRLQIVALIGLGAVGLTISALLVGLAIGALPHRMAASGVLPDREALALGVSTGLFGAAALAAASVLNSPEWAQRPNVAPLGTFVPFVDVLLDPIPGFLLRTAVVLTLLVSINAVTAGWTRQRAFGTTAIFVVGFLGAGGPTGLGLTGWLAAGAIVGASLWIAYVTVLRADLSMVPVALGTMLAADALASGIGRPFPGALAASIAAAVLVLAVSWLGFQALRRARARAAPAPAPIAP
jgi:hypothetical protein